MGATCQCMVSDVDKLARTHEAHTAIEDHEKGLGISITWDYCAGFEERFPAREKAECSIVY